MTTNNEYTMGTKLAFLPIGEMGTLQCNTPSFYMHQPISHTTYKNWRCDYCNAVNDIKYHQCKMCAADKPRSYDR